MQKNTHVYKAVDPVLDRETITTAAAVLRDGGLVVFATETVYGIGANALDRDAAARIFAAKGRPQDNPLIVHISRLEELPQLVADIPDVAVKLAGVFWPGPLTIILPKSPAVPDTVSGGLSTVAVRMPSHPMARALIRAAGVPVAAPSANRSGRPSPTTAEHCSADLEGRVDIILDSGSCEVGVESTVLTLVGKTPRLLRPGAVTLEELREVLGEIEIDSGVYHEIGDQTAVSSPGMKYRHYAPKAQITLVHGALADYLKLLRQKNAPGVFALVFEEDRGVIPLPYVTYGSMKNPASQAGQLFAALRELDRQGAQRVYARAPAMEGVGLAVYNRLVRAAAFNELYL